MIAQGMIQLSVTKSAELREIALREADNVMQRIQRREIMIDKKSAIPVFDMRAVRN